MANNFGRGARKMATAGTYAANAAVRSGSISFSHAAGLSTAWSLFTNFAKGEGVNKIEFVTRELVIGYGHELAMRVADQDLAAGTAQGYLSAVNRVMDIAATKGSWESVSATKVCMIPQRSFSRTDTPAALDRIA